MCGKNGCYFYYFFEINSIKKYRRGGVKLLVRGNSYTKEEIQEEFNLDTDKASNLIRKIEKMGYKATGNGRKGDNYRIIIKDVPQTVDIIKIFKSLHLVYTENNLTKIAQLLHSLGTEANYSYRSLENYNYFTDKTIKKYLEAFEKMGVVKLNFTNKVCYATKKRILTEEEHSYTQEEIENTDYYYVVDVKPITEEEYDKANKAYLEYIEEHKNDLDVVEDEMEFYAYMAKRDVLGGWTARRNAGERYEVNSNSPQVDVILSLLDNQNRTEYQRVKKGNHNEDELKWFERTEKWDEEREQKKRDREEYEKQMEKLKRERQRLIGEIELMKSWFSPEQLEQIEKIIKESEAIINGKI